MIIGPRNRPRVLIVANMPRRIRIGMLRVKEMCATNSTERTQRRSQISVIARRHNSAASLMEARDSLTIRNRQPMARINSEEPQLIDIRRIEHTQDSVVAFRVDLTIARGNFIKWCIAVLDRSEMLSQ